MNNKGVQVQPKLYRVGAAARGGGGWPPFGRRVMPGPPGGCGQGRGRGRENVLEWHPWSLSGALPSMQGVLSEPQCRALTSELTNQREIFFRITDDVLRLDPSRPPPREKSVPGNQGKMVIKQQLCCGHPPRT